ncbi:MAG: pyridoxamine 5'-phosphate oxidase [Cytophagales bacterium]|nr:pyridoxamine 5'-phosphate oxidase [Cytophagales bacterium]MDW8384641.1 pyridoxamine 5'-phosphate oxidase [Flammeovirgaceae bacterium]
MEEKLSIADLRKEYSLQTLDIQDVDPNPFKQFEKWLYQAINSQLLEPTAMVLSTATPDGKPSARVLLLKGIENDSFIFYTNYQSRKGKEIASNPHGAITFYWAELERQVRIEGKISFISEAQSEAYFGSRPRASQIAALASPQSQKIESREDLEKRFEQLREQYQNQEVPKPKEWGGYALSPTYFEFWQGRPSRLHDRIAYELIENTWNVYRLAP